MAGRWQQEAAAPGGMKHVQVTEREAAVGGAGRLVRAMAGRPACRRHQGALGRRVYHVVTCMHAEADHWGVSV